MFAVSVFAITSTAPDPPPSPRVSPAGATGKGTLTRRSHFVHWVRLILLLLLLSAALAPAIDRPWDVRPAA
jgi:hypothetical protein